MNPRRVVALAAFVMGAMVPGAPPGYAGPSMTQQAVQVSTETCTSAKTKFEAVAQTHATSPSLAKARREAASAAADCKNGKSANGIAAYTAAIRLLSA